MTKVTLEYDLTRKLSGDDLENVSWLHSVYGIVRVVPAPSLDKITVDYDASRLTKEELEAVLSKYGMPLRVKAAA